MATGDLTRGGMTVREVRTILEHEWIPDELVILDYEDKSIDEVNLVINRDGDCTDIRLTMIS